MIRKTLITIVGAVAMVAMIQTAQASITLGQLVSSGGSITVGDKTFSNFGYDATLADASALSSQAAGLIVTADIVNGIYYLDFNGGLAVDNLLGSGNLLGDLKLTYTVTAANPNLITMIDQNYTVNALPGSGQIIIGETVRNPLGEIKGNSTLTLNPLDLSDPLTEPGDNLVISPGQSQLLVTKDILIAAFAGQLVGLSDVEQSFHQAVPEPTTIIAGALLLLPFGASTLRILRKNRKA